MNRILKILQTVETEFPKLSKLDQAILRKSARKQIYPDTVQRAYREGYISTTEKQFLLDKTLKWGTLDLNTQIAIRSFMLQYRAGMLRRIWFWRKWV